MPLANLLLRRAYAAIRVAGVLDVKRLLWVSADALHRVPFADGYQVRMPSRAELAAALDAQSYPAEIGSAERLDDPNSTLLTAHCGAELAAYVWFASRRVAAEQNFSRASHLGTALQLPPGTAFAYNAWTAPSHRGRRLMPALLSHAVAPGRCGAAGLVSTTDWTNAAALSAFRRVGFRELGLIYRVGRPRWQTTRAPSQAKAHGIQIGGK